MRQGLGRAVVHGMLIGGITVGVVGGLWTATNCYLGRLDPAFYPNRSLLVLGFTFGLGLVFAVVPGTVLGIVGSVIVFYSPRREQSMSLPNNAQAQDTWPPAPMTTEGESNDSDT